MIKNLSRLEQVVNDKVYHLLCDMDSPISDVRLALNVFQQYIDQVEEAAKAKAECACSQEAPIEDAKVESPQTE